MQSQESHKNHKNRINRSTITKGVSSISKLVNL
jgi:hypothetical protein